MTLIVILALILFFVVAFFVPKSKRKKPDSNEVSLLGVYNTFYDITVSSPQITKCKNYAPVTAAVLLVTIDVVLLANLPDDTREKHTSEVIKNISEKFTEEECTILCRCLNVFGRTVADQITPRGDWRTNKEEPSAWTQKLAMVYGDLLKFPDYIFNYENAPISLMSLSDCTEFAIHFEPFASETLALLANMTKKWLNRTKD